jgi:hypothetical protein
MQSDAFTDPFASARVRLSDGRELSGADGLQVWMARRYEREQQEART